VPYQFLAKMYSEALGRAPDQGGWQSWVNYFQQNPSSPASLRHVGEAFYNQAGEFGNDYGRDGTADNAARLLALYRGALNREPDAGGLSYHLQRLSGGQDTWEATVDNFFNTDANSEFTQTVVPQINGPNSSYGFGAGAVVAIPTNPVGQLPANTYAYTGSDGRGLQLLLNQVHDSVGGHGGAPPEGGDFPPAPRHARPTGLFLRVAPRPGGRHPHHLRVPRTQVVCPDGAPRPHRTLRAAYRRQRLDSPRAYLLGGRPQPRLGRGLVQPLGSGRSERQRPDGLRD
jgi:hypothetical protein